MEHVSQHVGSLEVIIEKVSQSRGGVVELSMDSRGLTKMMPQLVVDSINVAIHKNVSKLLSVKLSDEKIKDITISNRQAKMELNIVSGPYKYRLNVELKNNSQNNGLDSPIITIDPPTFKNPLPFGKTYNLQEIANEVIANNTIDSSLQVQLSNHKDIKDKVVIEKVEVFFDKDDQVHLKIHTKAP